MKGEILGYVQPPWAQRWKGVLEGVDHVMSEMRAVIDKDRWRVLSEHSVQQLGIIL
jgi:hypothetical protein